MITASLPLADQVPALRSGRRSLLAEVETVCDRLEALDPQVQAFLPEADRRARLRRDAQALLERYPDPAARPPLFGAFLAVKDIFRVEGFATGCGTALPSSLFDGPEAACVTNLRQAGALIVGKTVTTEFAYLEPGPTRNPHNLGHTPGGSSSGSAAAAAAGFCALALGTQTVGSVIRPAAYCGVVGYKPSYGRISPEGVIPFSRSADHIGCFTADAAGMALAAAVLCRAWEPAAVTRRPVLGVPEGPYLMQATAEGLGRFDAQVAYLTAAGYTVKRVPALTKPQAVAARHRQMIAAELAEVHREWFTAYEGLYRPLTAALIREGQTVRPEDLAAARQGRAHLRAKLHEQMRDAGIDLWVCPAAPGPAPEGISSTGDSAMNLPWTHAGLPVVTLPAGRAANGLPLGLQVAAPFMADERLLAWAGPLAAVLGELG
ncbi:MAG: amidase [Chloroflexi bacterium]|nr:amidase [Chloroflexota bacterium]